VRGGRGQKSGGRPYSRRRGQKKKRQVNRQSRRIQRVSRATAQERQQLTDKKMAISGLHSRKGGHDADPRICFIKVAATKRRLLLGAVNRLDEGTNSKKRLCAGRWSRKAGSREVLNRGDLAEPGRRKRGQQEDKKKKRQKPGGKQVLWDQTEWYRGNNAGNPGRKGRPAEGGVPRGDGGEDEPHGEKASQGGVKGKKKAKGKELRVA